MQEDKSPAQNAADMEARQAKSTAGTKRLIAAVCGAAVLCAGGVYVLSQPVKPGSAVVVSETQPSPEPSPLSSHVAAEPEPSPKTMFVYVLGEVANPGVYELPEGARLDDAVKAAGGATEDADLMINLARLVKDGEQIIVPKLGEQAASPEPIPEETAASGEIPEEAPAPEEGGQAVAFPININTADAEALDALPGVGSVIAGNIIAYRDQSGGFKTKEELLNVNRIGMKLYEEIEELITIE